MAQYTTTYDETFEVRYDGDSLSAAIAIVAKTNGDTAMMYVSDGDPGIYYFPYVPGATEYNSSFYSVSGGTYLNDVINGSTGLSLFGLGSDGTVTEILLNDNLEPGSSSVKISGTFSSITAQSLAYDAIKNHLIVYTTGGESNELYLSYNYGEYILIRNSTGYTPVYGSLYFYNSILYFEGTQSENNYICQATITEDIEGWYLNVINTINISSGIIYRMADYNGSIFYVNNIPGDTAANLSYIDPPGSTGPFNQYQTSVLTSNLYYGIGVSRNLLFLGNNVTSMIEVYLIENIQELLSTSYINPILKLKNNYQYNTWTLEKITNKFWKNKFLLN